MYKITEIDIFSKLPQNYRNKIEKKVFTQSYKKNSIIFFEGDNPDCIYAILKGSVKLYKTSPKGNKVYINILNAPSLVGEYAYFQNKPFPATCETLEDSKIAMIPFDLIEELLEFKEFNLEIINSLINKVMLLSTLVHKETILSSEAKIADILVTKPEIFKRLKNSEIASILNIAPETFSRILSKFKKENIAIVKNHNVEILDKDKLYEILETNKIKECTNCIANLKIN